MSHGGAMTGRTTAATRVGERVITSRAWRRIAQASLVASWAALVTHDGGSVEVARAFVAARSPQAIFNNVLLLQPDVEAVARIRRFYEGASRWNLWTGSRATARAVGAMEFREDGVTWEMARSLGRLLEPDPAVSVEEADPAVVARVNRLPDTVIPRDGRVRAFADLSGSAGAVTFRHGDDIQLSFVATSAAERGRGLATAVVLTALRTARDEGARTATLQATPIARSLYERLGFIVIRRWQEWVPPNPGRVHRDGT